MGLRLTTEVGATMKRRKTNLLVWKTMVMGVKSKMMKTVKMRVQSPYLKDPCLLSESLTTLFYMLSEAKKPTLHVRRRPKIGLNL